MNNPTVLIPVFVVTLIFVGIGLAAYLAWRAEKKRTEVLRGVADDLGFDFSATAPPEFPSRLGKFHLFSQGHSKKYTNVMSGRTAHLHVTIFDYRYTTGHGKGSRTWSTTVICFRADALDLPGFALRPETFWHKVGSTLFGYQDIDFETHPVFSKAFLLKGPDEEAVRAAFTPAVLDHFETIPGVSAEAAGDTLVFYRYNARTSPDKLRDLLAEGFAVHGLFHRPTESPPTTTDHPE
jgi:hypothetical protein